MANDAVELSAGPVRLRLADGELRYVSVGSEEVVRRVFFAVRTKSWDTVTPKFESVDITHGKDGFQIALKARCTGLEGVDYSWDAEIMGRGDGTITFKVSGLPNTDFETNRIGICVLFGTPTVCGERYELSGKEGKTRSGIFPVSVNAPLTFEPDFTQLRSPRTEVSVTGSDGTIFSMEDQRNFADSSFKAYAPLPYAYPTCKKGERYEATVTIRPRLAPNAPLKPVGNTRLTFDTSAIGRLPQLKTGSTGERNWFHGVNHEREKYQSQPAISFAYFPTEHLFDDDTCWENVPVIVELAESARKIYGPKPIDIHHIALDPTHARPRRDPRNASSFGSAWTAACLKYAALANVRSATFDLGPGHSTRLLKRLEQLIGQPVASPRVQTDALVAPVDACLIARETVVLWNKTRTRQRVALAGISTGPWNSETFDGTTSPSAPPTRSVHRGETLVLNPLEVRILSPSRR
jgi:hypothetical protein